MAMPLAGANAGVNGRIMRLCLKSPIYDIIHPLGRLGRFAGMRIRPSRAIRIRFIVAPSSLGFFSRTDRQ